MRAKISVIVIIGLLAVTLGAFFVSRSRPGREEGGKLKVVATFTPLTIFAMNVAGDAAEIVNLLPQGVGPHDYAFRPSDVQKIAEADVVIKQGRGIDAWLDGMIVASGRTDLTVIVASEGIPPHTGVPRYSPDSGLISPSQKIPLVRPDPNDPHLWLDPFLAIREVERIRDGLMKADPDHASEYIRNAENYLLTLLNLDTEIRLAFRELKSRDFVAFHAAFRYFAYEYELREVAVIEEIPGREPSPSELKELVDEVRRMGVSVIFSEPQFSPKIVETLARDYGLAVVEIDTLETGELRADYYEEVMRKNVRAIVEVLSS